MIKSVYKLCTMGLYWPIFSKMISIVYVNDAVLTLVFEISDFNAILCKVRSNLFEKLSALNFNQKPVSACYLIQKSFSLGWSTVISRL